MSSARLTASGTVSTQARGAVEMPAKKARAAFLSLIDAANENRLVLAQCQDLRTQRTTFVVCEVVQEGATVTYNPLSRLFSGNPLNEVTPPGVAAKILM